jgi:sphingomyelin phosphodiesterase 2
MCSLVSLNTRGVPLFGSLLAERYATIGSALEAGDVCGDFNVDRDCPLFAGFVTGARLADAFAGGCPATFRAEYLPPNAKPHCIDFILTGDAVTAEAATVVFAGKEPLTSGPGYVSDHLGLRATLSSGRV